jgi:hypothetical protein
VPLLFNHWQAPAKKNSTPATIVIISDAELR